MEFTLTTAVKEQAIDLEKFLELWPLLTSQGLLQALEAASGKTVSLFLFDAPAGGSKVEMLVDLADSRAAVDRGDGACWGRWTAEGGTSHVVLEDGSGEYVLAGGQEPGATMRWVAKG